MSIRKLPIRSTAETINLDDWGPVGLPLSEPTCQLRGSKMVLPLENNPEIGLWECTPGRYRRQVVSAETMHVISGQATFTPDDGDPFPLQAGDIHFFPLNTNGVWDIHETLRKVYVLFKPA
jgi:uncharacterized cupin superfamily protein